MKKILMLTGAVLALSAPTAHAGWFDNYVVLDKSATDPHIQEQIKLAIHDNCARNVLPDAVKRGDKETVSKLLMAKVDVNQSGYHEHYTHSGSLLTIAVRNAADHESNTDQQDIAKMLILAGAKTDSATLAIAASMKNTELAKMLIDAGTPVNDIDSHLPCYSSTLNIALRKANPAMVKLLINARATSYDAIYALALSSPSEHWSTICVAKFTHDISERIFSKYPYDVEFDRAQYKQHITEIMDILIASGLITTTTISVFDIFCATSNQYVLQELIKRGVDLAQDDGNGTTPLDHAMKHGHFTSARILADAGAPCSRWTKLLMTLYGI